MPCVLLGFGAVRIGPGGGCRSLETRWSRRGASGLGVVDATNVGMADFAIFAVWERVLLHSERLHSKNISNFAPTKDFAMKFLAGEADPPIGVVPDCVQNRTMDNCGPE
eukprot:scaffold21966_cov36-Cyclotella_meneghiniana.AAC.1